MCEFTLHFDKKEELSRMMVRHVKALKNGQSILCPVYDYRVHNRSQETQLIELNSVLVQRIRAHLLAVAGEISVPDAWVL